MDRYPLMLFCFPVTAIAGAAPEPLQDGIYGTCTVNSDDELAAAKAEGWHERARDAWGADDVRIAAALPQEEPSTSGDRAPDDNAPPTRAELEAKATELGIKFNAKTSDKALGDRIAAALEP